MRDIKDCTDSTSSYELFTHIYWKVVSRAITGFSDLVDYLADLEEGPRKEYVLQSAFPLIREIHWGFFRELNPKTTEVLWNQLTRPHPKYPFAGELKRSMTITDIYCAFVDLHGYTAFSRKPGDSSLLKLLDICIEEDVKQICRDNHVLSNRVRGDEIILIGTSAYDVVSAVGLIADYFGDRRIVGTTDIVRKRRDEILKLPDMTISAGISGGKKYTSLVITATGDLSGTVVNTAARLQSRANMISPDKSRILTTQNVKIKYLAEASIRYAPAFADSQLAFLDVGSFSFKGVEVQLSEILMDPGEMYRLEYQEQISLFLEALKNDHWRDSVFITFSELLVQACKAMPGFEVQLPENDDGLSSMSNATIINFTHTAIDRFESGKQFSEAVASLLRATCHLDKVPGLDHFLLLYSEAVSIQYKKIDDAYTRQILLYLEKNRSRLFSNDENRKYQEAKVNASLYDMMKSNLNRRVDSDKRKNLWHRLIKEIKPSVAESLYLGK